MKKVFFFATFMLLASAITWSLSSCSSDDDEVSTSFDLVGTWKSFSKKMTTFYRFNSDGTGSLLMVENAGAEDQRIVLPLPITWSVSGKNLLVAFQTGEKSTSVMQIQEKTDTEMTVTYTDDEEGEQYVEVLEKCDDAEFDEYFQQKQEEMNQQLLGRWKNTDSTTGVKSTLQFYEKGKLIYALEKSRIELKEGAGSWSFNIATKMLTLKFKMSDGIRTKSYELWGFQYSEGRELVEIYLKDVDDPRAEIVYTKVTEAKVRP